MNKRYCVKCDNYMYSKDKNKHICLLSSTIMLNYVTGKKVLGRDFVDCRVFNKNGDCVKYLRTPWYSKFWRYLSGR